MVNHFRKHINRDIFSFCLRIAVESCFFATLTGIVLYKVIPSMRGGGGEKFEVTDWILISALIFAPLIETIFCQVLPVAVVRKFRGKQWLQVFVATAVFAAAHFYILGFVSGMTAGLIGGFYFSFTYVRWRKRSLRAAYWSTVFVHSVYNTFIYGIALLAG
ncbi:MAG: CPBP family intramembrane metalloprotease [FCB group bacterium]|nr:CPBP family intramembrane metalloprotease [FCB group bacterium]